MRIGGQIKTQQQEVKLLRMLKHAVIQRDDKVPGRQQLTSLTTQLEGINQKISAREDSRSKSSNTKKNKQKTKNKDSKWTKENSTKKWMARAQGQINDRMQKNQNNSGANMEPEGI